MPFGRAVVAALLAVAALPGVLAANEAVVGNVRYGAYLLRWADPGAPILATVLRGERVEVVESLTSDRYVLVRHGGRLGWIGRRFLVTAPAPVPRPGGPPLPPIDPAGERPAGVPGFDDLARPPGTPGPGPTEGAPPSGGSLPPRDAYAARAIGEAARLVSLGVRFDDFGDDAIDNDGDWQPTDAQARADPRDADGRMDDTGADGIPQSGDVWLVSAVMLVAHRYERQPLYGGEGDGQPTPGEPDLDGRDPDERNTHDGTHLSWYRDGKDNNGNGLVDEPEEMYIVCIDLVTMALAAAGYDLPRMMAEDARRHPHKYGPSGRGAPNTARDPYLARRIPNVELFLRTDPRFEYFAQPSIHRIDAVGRTPFAVGDVVFFGYTRDLGTPGFRSRHSGVVTEVDPATGMPARMISMRADGAREDVFDEDLFRALSITGHARPRRR